MVIFTIPFCEMTYACWSVFRVVFIEDVEIGNINEKPGHEYGVDLELDELGFLPP